MRFAWLKYCGKWNSPWLMAIMASILMHLLSGGGLSHVSRPPNEPKLGAIKIHVTEISPKKTEEVPPKPTKPIEKERRPKPTPTPNLSVPLNAPTTLTPVQGLTKESLGGPGTMSAPVGNTLMIEDTGKRVKEVESLKGDQSAPAKLVAGTLSPPPYTDDALDAGLEGSFIVDVLVNIDGGVSEAELRKKIGHKMDERVLAAVRASKFIPRRNRFGTAEEGWTELKFTLVIP
jgi:TonB family protein